jgi:hypothetical protein
LDSEKKTCIFKGLGIFRKDKHFLQKYRYILAAGVQVLKLELVEGEAQNIVEEMVNELYDPNSRHKI